jgi:hypothetical protein
MRDTICLLFLALALVGCGENQDTTSPATSFGPPENLKALAVNATTVGLQWTAPTGQPDSLGGYVVQVGNSKDTLSKTTLSYLADSLTAGEKTFTVYARRKSGTLSDGAVIKWAPAARFEGPYVVYEYRTAQPSVTSALDVGTATLDPAPVTVTAANASRMDIYLFGGTAATQEALQLQSTSMLASVYNSTMFSTVTSSSAGLDYYLASFPAATTFTQDHVTVADNTICYIRVVGDNGNFNYARIHVHVRSGDTNPRAVEIRVSLQRSPGMILAFDGAMRTEPRGVLGLIGLPGGNL